MAFYKQSTAYTRMFLMVQSSDHITALTGASPTVNISKAGAAFGAAGGTVTEVANGFYKIVLTTTDTNTVGDLAFHITATSGDATDFTDQVWVRDLADLAYPATSGRSMVVDASGLVDANMVKTGPTGSGTAQTARDLGASVLLSAGTGTGQLDFTSGVIKANLAQILGTALTETSGQIAAAFKQFFNIASPTSTMNLITAVTTATTATNLTNAPTAGDFTAAMKTSLNAATPAVTVSDKTGFSLSAAGIQAVWDALTSALTTVGSIGKLLATNIDTTISSRGTSTLTQTQVTGGAYSVQSASCVLGDARVAHLDADVSSRLASASYTAPDNTSITAIKAKTDSLTFTVANQVDSNIRGVNSHNVTGDGHTGTEWGPA